MDSLLSIFSLADRCECVMLSECIKKIVIDFSELARLRKYLRVSCDAAVQVSQRQRKLDKKRHGL